MVAQDRVAAVVAPERGHARLLAEHAVRVVGAVRRLAREQAVHRERAAARRRRPGRTDARSRGPSRRARPWAAATITVAPRPSSAARARSRQPRRAAPRRRPRAAARATPGASAIGIAVDRTGRRGQQEREPGRAPSPRRAAGARRARASDRAGTARARSRAGAQGPRTRPGGRGGDGRARPSGLLLLRRRRGDARPAGADDAAGRPLDVQQAAALGAAEVDAGTAQGSDRPGERTSDGIAHRRTSPRATAPANALRAYAPFARGQGTALYRHRRDALRASVTRAIRASVPANTLITSGAPSVAHQQPRHEGRRSAGRPRNANPKMLSTRPRIAAGAFSCTSELSVEKPVTRHSPATNSSAIDSAWCAGWHGADGREAVDREAEQQQPAAARAPVRAARSPARPRSRRRRSSRAGSCSPSRPCCSTSPAITGR